MNITIVPKPLSGIVNVVSSKSLSHRYVIGAGLAKGTSIIENVLQSDDLDATKLALSCFGVTFEDQKIHGAKLKVVRDVIDCKESGSTLRFMIPIVMTQKDSVTFIGRGRLPQRPLDVYAHIFPKEQYRYTSKDSLPLEVKGILKPGRYKIPGNISSQFITGLLYALPLLDGPSVIELTSPLESKGYVDLTLDVLRDFGIQIEDQHGLYQIKGNQIYRPLEHKVEGDFSQAAFWMVAGLIGSTLFIGDLNPNSRQGDAAIISIIKQMFGDIVYHEMNQMFVVNQSKTKATTIDLSNIPDLGPILMVLAALSTGTTIFTNISRLRIKESDRVDAMYKTLIKFGVSVSIHEDEMMVTGRNQLKGSQHFDSFNDHRIAMAIAIAAIRADGPVTIVNAEVVKKSYPNFYEIYQKLGGEIHAN